MLLILAGVTISMLTGGNTILTKAENATERMAKEAAKEKLKLQYQDFTISAIKENKTVKNYLESLSEQQKTVLKANGITIEEITDNGITFICDDYMIENDLKGNIVNCYKAGIKINVIAENKDIIVEIKEISEKANKIEVIKDDVVLGNIEIQQDGKGSYTTNQDGTYVVKVITENNNEILKEIKIDTIAPQYSDLTIKSEGKDKITDNFSGISKMKIYYKNSTEEKYKCIEKQYTLELEKIINEEITGLEAGTSYNVYIEIYDNANNMITSLSDSNEPVTTQVDLSNVSIQEGLISYWPLKSNLRNMIAGSEYGNFVAGDDVSTMTFENESVVIGNKLGLKSEITTCTLPAEFTFCVDAKFNTLITSYVLFGLSSNSDRDTYRYSDKENAVWVGGNNFNIYNGVYGNASKSIDITTDEWYRIVVTGDSTGWNIFINGNNVHNRTGYKQISGGNLSLGKGYPTSSYSGSSMDGYLKNCAMYDRVLTTEEIQNLEF